jgi:hypothetical protein
MDQITLHIPRQVQKPLRLVVVEELVIEDTGHGSNVGGSDLAQRHGHGSEEKLGKVDGVEFLPLSPSFNMAQRRGSNSRRRHNGGTHDCKCAGREHPC